MGMGLTQHMDNDLSLQGLREMDHTDYITGIGNSSHEQYIYIHAHAGQSVPTTSLDLQEKPQKCTKSF